MAFPLITRQSHFCSLLKSTNWYLLLCAGGVLWSGTMERGLSWLTCGKGCREAGGNRAETSMLHDEIVGSLDNHLNLGVNLHQVRFASKKQGGSTQNNKDSNPKYLGLKLFGGQHCIPGNIIVRQRGKRFHPGTNVGIGKDHTIFSLVEGNVYFTKDKKKKRTFIHVKQKDS